MFLFADTCVFNYWCSFISFYRDLDRQTRTRQKLKTIMRTLFLLSLNVLNVFDAILPGIFCKVFV